MSTATEPQHKIKVSDAGPSLKKISVEIPAAIVDRKIRDTLDALSANAALPGFRAGKVPKWLIEKRFGSALKRDAKNELAGEAYRKAVEEHKLNPVSDPSGGTLDKAELVEGKPFAFEVEVEVLPEFTLPSLEGVAIRKPKLDITSEAVEEEIRKVCINEGSLESREKAEAGDYLTGHAVMKGKDGTVFYDLKGAVVQKPTADKKGSGMILGIMVDDFDKQMGGPKPGDTFTVKAKGPSNHEVEGVRGNDLTMTFAVDRIDRIVPAKIEEIVQLFGVENEAALRDQIRQRMDINVRVRQQAAMHQQAAKHLLDNVKMDLPSRLTTSQSARNLERRRMELIYRGVDQQKVEEHMAELRRASDDTAQRDLKLFFIMHRAAEKLGVNVTENEMNLRITQLAAQRGVRPEQLVQELRRGNQLGMVAQQIRDHKVLDAVVAKANVTEISAEEYNKSVAEKV
jgi:trigger factor